MSFWAIKDPLKRDKIIKDYLATKERLKKSNLDERARDFNEQNKIEKVLQPFTESTNAIAQELVPIKQVLDKTYTYLQEAAEERGKNKNHQFIQDVPENNEEVLLMGNAYEQYMNDVKIGDLDQYFRIIESTGFTGYQLGDTPISITKNSDIRVRNTTYKGTNGLWALIMLARPDETNYNADDLNNYEQLVEQCNVIQYPNNLRTNSRPKSTYKWRTIFSRFNSEAYREEEAKQAEKKMRKRAETVGEAIQFLPSDIKGLHKKLSYLLGEFQAGNISATRNEIVSISDELLRRKDISLKEYRKINDYVQRKK